MCIVDGASLRKDKYPYATTAMKQIHSTGGQLYYFSDVNAKNVTANKTRVYVPGNACGAYSVANPAAAKATKKA